MTLLIIGMLLSNVSMAQDMNVKLKQAIESKNVKLFAKDFDKRIEIVIDDQANDYSQQQAQVVLNKFLGRFSDVSFELINNGISKSKAKYYIGIMKAKEATYRVYVYLKKINSSDFIQEIKFEKQ